MEHKSHRFPSEASPWRGRFLRKRKQIAVILSGAVILGTVSVLSLPALTMSRPQCGLEEHQHSEDCYAPRQIETLSCTEKVHTHTERCYDRDGELICGQADFVVHTHDARCYDGDGKLICPLPEVKEHTHTDACYIPGETTVLPGHTHTDDCYEWSMQLACGQEEWTPEPQAEGDEADPELGHQHTDACYEFVRGGLICGQEESAPTVIEGEPILVCDKPEVKLHTHSASCTGDCIEVKEHQHTDACFTVTEGEPELVRGLEEHQHDESCLQAPQEASSEEHGAAPSAEVPPEALPMEEVLTEEPEATASAEPSSAEAQEAPEATDSVLPEEAEASLAEEETLPSEAPTAAVPMDPSWIPGIDLQNDAGLWETYPGSGPMRLHSEDSLSFRLHYEIPAGTLSEEAPAIRYPLPECLLAEEAGGDIVNGSGERLGSYSVSKEGEILITFSEETVQSNLDGAPITNAYIPFSATVREDAVDAHGDVAIPFTDTLIVLLHMEDAAVTTWDLTAEMEATDTDEAAMTVQYRLVVTSQGGTSAAVKLEDWLTGAALEGEVLVDDAATEVTVTDAGRHFALELPDMAPGEAYTITYTAKALDPETGSDPIQVVNRATVESTGTHGAALYSEATHTQEFAVPEPQLVYHYEDELVSVTATPQYPDALPAGAELQVTRVQEGTESYSAYMGALQSSVSDGSQRYTAENTLLYDVAFLIREGEEVEELQPTEGSVALQFVFKDQTGVDEALSVVHLPLTDEARKQAPTTVQATAITAEDVQVEPVAATQSEETLFFDLDSFSVVAVTTDENGNTTYDENVVPGTPYTYIDVLGNAVNYGIVADTIYKDGHMDTTFATKHLTSNGNITTGAYTAGNAGSPIIIGDIQGKLQIDGHANAVYTTEAVRPYLTLQNGSYAVIWDQDSINAEVDSMVAHVNAMSQAMAQEESYQILTNHPQQVWNESTRQHEWIDHWEFDQNSKVLNLSGCDNGTIYIDADQFLALSDIKIIKKPGQTIVFNLSGEDVTLKRFEVANVDHEVPNENGLSFVSSATSDASVEPYAKTVIFNMPNATSLHIESAIFGVVIAPNAAVSMGSTCSGWIVANSFTNPGGEWHYVDQDLDQPLKVTTQVSKTLDGDTPEESVKFNFRREDWNDEAKAWADGETAQNHQGAVLFRKDYSAEGTYYYRLSEMSDSGTEYRYDARQYIVKIDVTLMQDNTNSKILKADQTFYRMQDGGSLADWTPDGDPMLAQLERVDSSTFQNTSSNGGYELPKTGGIGTAFYYMAGLILLLGCIIPYTLRRRRKEAS